MREPPRPSADQYFFAKQGDSVHVPRGHPNNREENTQIYSKKPASLDMAHYAVRRASGSVLAPGVSPTQRSPKMVCGCVQFVCFFRALCTLFYVIYSGSWAHGRECSCDTFIIFSVLYSGNSMKPVLGATFGTFVGRMLSVLY